MPIPVTSGMSTLVFDAMLGGLTNFRGAGIMVFKTVLPIALGVLITVAVGTFMIHLFLRITGMEKWLAHRELEQKAHEAFESDLQAEEISSMERQEFQDYYRGDHKDDDD